MHSLANFARPDKEKPTPFPLEERPHLHVDPRMTKPTLSPYLAYNLPGGYLDYKSAQWFGGLKLTWA